MTPRQPLDYEPPRMPAYRERTLSAGELAAGLGAWSLLWAMIAWLAPFPAAGYAIRWMLISGMVPSALIGGLIAAIAARGRWRGPGLVANGLALAIAAWLMAQLL